MQPIGKILNAILADLEPMFADEIAAPSPISGRSDGGRPVPSGLVGRPPIYSVAESARRRLEEAEEMRRGRLA